MTKNHRTYICDICKIEYPDSKEFRIVCPSCVALAMRKMTNEQYHAWLIHNRSRIWQGLPLEAWDDETIGNKDMYVSWGMCSDDMAAYPDPETWAYGPITKPNHLDPTRIRVIDRGKDHHCPFDRRLVGDFKNTNEYNGCFWSCRIFEKEIKKDDRDKAIEWFDKAIEKAKKKHEI